MISIKNYSKFKSIHNVVVDILFSNFQTKKNIFEIDIIDILQSIYLSNNNFLFSFRMQQFFFLLLIVDSYKSYDIFFYDYFFLSSTKQKTSPPFFHRLFWRYFFFYFFVSPIFFPIVILIPSIHSMILVKLFDFFFCR